MPSKKAAKIELATIQLNHICNIPEASGLPGDVIAVPPDVAERLIGRGGAVGVTSTEDVQTENQEPEGDET